MDTKRYTPERVVEENLSFSIPLYQRLFAWGEEQVRGLMMDMKEHFDKSESPYYLGMLSCISNNGHYDLIDGQQRFTVMTLLGIVLRDYYTRWEDFLAEGKRVRFVARTKDKEYLHSRIVRDASVPDPNWKMESAIKTIKLFMEDANNFPSELDKNKYAQSVYHKLSIYFSALPKEYMNDPTSLNKYFEAMNAHGKSLEQHEVLKVDLMKEEPEKELLTKIWNAVSEMGSPIIKKANDDEPIHVYRQRYEYAIDCCRKGDFYAAFNCCAVSYDGVDNETIESIPVKQPERSQAIIPHGTDEERLIISFPDYLLMMLDITCDLNGKYLFYRKELICAFKENRLYDIRAFYHNLLFCRFLLDYYVITKEDGKSGNRYDILYNGNGDSLHDKECTIQYQSMLYVSQTPIYEWLKPLLVELMRKRPSGLKELLLGIKSRDDTYHKLPEAKISFAYDKGVDRYWFWRLDYYLWEQAEKYFEDNTERDIVNDYVFRANRSIEHLHPQHQEHNTEWASEDVHAFGNLAMISQGFNSEQSDDPVTVKFARILDQANNHNLQSLKLYRMYLDAGKSPGGWTIEKMQQHQEKMLEILRDSYIR